MCFYNLYYVLITAIIFMNIKYSNGFNVNFQYNYNLQQNPFNTQIYKRELMEYFDKASFSFNGFKKVASIPVLFPIDICVFSVGGIKYATGLHAKGNGTKHFDVLKMQNDSYQQIAVIAAPNCIAMDCIEYNNRGYVALVLNLTEPIQYAKEASPIYEIFGNHIRAVQYFAAPNLTTAHLHVSGNEFFLLHTYASSQASPHLYCPYFKWSGSTFNKLGSIPCSNAHQLTPFSIDYESYVAVANYADQNGYTSTTSEIYKYSSIKKKFLLFQKVATSGAVDVQYFNVPLNEMKRQHFLVFGNSIRETSVVKKANTKREVPNLNADSVFYLYDKGQFIPYQKLSLYAVKKFLPVQHREAEKFILLVACTDQDIKIYNFNDWKFEESKVQFTQGAFGTGVSNMRIYQENENSYVIIANKLMGDNETNIFLPIFKQEPHANTLRQQIIDWCNAAAQSLQAVNVKALAKRVEEKLKDLQQRQPLPKVDLIQQANFRTVTTKSLVYQKFKMSSNYWLALNFVNQALDALEIMFKQKQRPKRDTGFSDQENPQHIYDLLNVKALTVNKYLKAKNINGVNSFKPVFENIKAKKVITSKIYIKPIQERANSLENENEMVMNIKDLQIKGKLNEYIWNDLLNNTLKRAEETQLLQAAIQIETLKTKIVIVKADKINKQDLDDLILVDAGKYVIDQAVQFNVSLKVNQLHIFDRLNNLQVFQNQFEVLLKKSNETQVITGLKNITNIKVMEPITVAGKTKGAQLEAIAPNKIIHEPLVLQGNFTINGDVFIQHKLSTLDVIAVKENVSVKQVLDMGIRMDKNLSDVNLKFMQPLKANNSFISFVNQYDLQSLVQLNQNDIQFIEGKKIFNASLEIALGFSEVKILNGIDMDKLENQAFLKHNNQTIKVPMKIGKISTKSIQSPVILLNSKNLSDYLTITANQSIQGSLNVKNLKAQSLLVDYLNTDSKIFQQNLHDIYQQKSRNSPPPDLFKPNHKFHGSLYVQNLIINSTINSKPVKVIENQILQLNGNIKYVGNFKFNYPMNISTLIFEGKLNGIPAADFGKCWLQKKADQQVFTAAQTINILQAEAGGLQLQGKLNGFTMEEFHTKTYWINRKEYIPCANFENSLEIMGCLTTKTLNMNLVPHVFHQNYKQKPIKLETMFVNEHLSVEGTIFNLVSINKVKLHELVEFLNGKGNQTLHVENAYFLQSPPVYRTLNNHYIQKTLDSVWLANENVILLHHIQLGDAHFEGLLEFAGTINDIDLDYLKENYFSKTKSQHINVEMVFSKGAKVENEINVNHLLVLGALTEKKSGISFNFDEFVKNTLKTWGPKIIVGNWFLPEVILEGNLNSVLINQLKLVDDILLNIKPMQTFQLNASKTFKNVNIENLYTDSSSLINRVRVANWISNAVYGNKNYTIRGVTTMDFLNVYKNLLVFEKLNNITYNENYLLLKNTHQTITGSIRIVNRLDKEHRFLTNNIQQLAADYINRQHMPTFMENLIPVAATTAIRSNLTFKYPVKVEHFEGPETFLNKNQWVKRNVNDYMQLNYSNIHNETDETLKEFSEINNYLIATAKNQIYKLDHFDILQTLKTKSPELFTFSIKIDSLLVDILTVVSMQHKNVTTYKWIPKDKKFCRTKEFDWMPHDPLLLRILHKRYAVYEQSTDDKTLKTFIRQHLKEYYKVLSNMKFSDYFEFLNETCIEYQKNLLTSTELQTFCLNSQRTEKISFSNSTTDQIIRFGNKHFSLHINNSVFISNRKANAFKILQKLPTPKPKQIALGSFKKFLFVAVLNDGHANPLNYGFVEIYRSINSSVFTLFQSLTCVEPLKIGFSSIKRSNDFLLHVITGSSIQPYLIYQYQGVMGFKEMLSQSILPKNLSSFNIVNLYTTEQYLVALSSQDEITLLELTIKI